MFCLKISSGIDSKSNETHAKKLAESEQARSFILKVNGSPERGREIAISRRYCQSPGDAGASIIVPCYRSSARLSSSALQFGSAVRRSCDPGERLRLFEVRKVIENKQGVQQEDYLQSELDRPEELLNAVAECAGRVRWPSANQCARERWPLFAIRLWSLQSSQSRGSRGNVAKEMTRASRPARRHSLLRQ